MEKKEQKICWVRIFFQSIKNNATIIISFNYFDLCIFENNNNEIALVEDEEKILFNIIFRNKVFKIIILFY